MHEPLNGQDAQLPLTGIKTLVRNFDAAHPSWLYLPFLREKLDTTTDDIVHGTDDGDAFLVHKTA